MLPKLARRAAKATVAGTLYYSGALRWLARLRLRSGPRVHILGYHRVVGDFAAASSAAIPALCIAQETFRRHLEFLSEQFDVVPLDTALAVLAGRYRPRREVATITFDDAYRDVHRYALPVLRELRIPATVFVPTGYVGSRRGLPHDRLYELLRRLEGMPRSRVVGIALPHLIQRPLIDAIGRLASSGPSLATDRLVSGMPAPALRDLIEAIESIVGAASTASGGEAVMTWSELRELAGGGVEIGSHTVGHVVLTNVPPVVVARELADSKAEIESNLRLPVRFFAYPNGRYSSDVIAALGRTGYVAAVTTEDLPNLRGGNPFTLKRKVLWEGHARGLLGGYSHALSAGHLTDAFGTLGVRRVEPGEMPGNRESEGST